MITEKEIEHCIKILKAGGIILYPTDTVWGIGCDATNEIAVSKIYKLKKRDEEKSMIILLSSEKDISKYTGREYPDIAGFLNDTAKPVTIIFSHAENLALNLMGKDGSIGIRIVKDEFCIKLINAFGKPIVSTSSNVSGYPPAAIFADIDPVIKKGVDYIVQHRQDDNIPGVPSTVIRLNPDDTFRVLRP